MEKFKLDMCEVMDQNRIISLGHSYLIIKSELVHIQKRAYLATYWLHIMLIPISN